MPIYTTRGQCSAETGEKIVIGRVLTRGRTKICFRRQLPLGNRLCPSERRSGICDFHVPKGMATLDSGTVRLRLHGSSPFCSPRIVGDQKKQPYVVAVKPKLFRNTFRFPGKKNQRDRIPRDTLDSFPGRRNRGDQNARDTFDSFPGKMHRADQTP